MKKTIFTIFVAICAVFFSSCDNDFFRELLSGNARTTIGENEPEDYTSSIVMFSNVDTMPFTLCLSMNMDVNQLLNLHGPEDIIFPLMAYRLMDTLYEGQTITFDNVLTEEDLEGFDFEWLINGKFADKHIIGIAESDSLFYIMGTGSVNISSKSSSKLTGTFTGSAYVIDLGATPILSEERVSMSGEFTSRVAPVMKWLMKMQDHQEVAEN